MGAFEAVGAFYMILCWAAAGGCDVWNCRDLSEVHFMQVLLSVQMQFVPCTAQQ